MWFLYSCKSQFLKVTILTNNCRTINPSIRNLFFLNTKMDYFIIRQALAACPNLTLNTYSFRNGTWVNQSSNLYHAHLSFQQGKSFSKVVEPNDTVQGCLILFEKSKFPTDQISNFLSKFLFERSSIRESDIKPCFLLASSF